MRVSQASLRQLGTTKTLEQTHLKSEHENWHQQAQRAISRLRVWVWEFQKLCVALLRSAGWCCLQESELINVCVCSTPRRARERGLQHSSPPRCQAGIDRPAERNNAPLIAVIALSLRARSKRGPSCTRAAGRPALGKIMLCVYASKKNEAAAPAKSFNLACLRQLSLRFHRKIVVRRKKSLWNSAICYVL